MAIGLVQDRWSDAKVISMNKSARWETTAGLHSYINVSPLLPDLYRDSLHSVIEYAKPVLRDFCVNGGMAGNGGLNWFTPFDGLSIKGNLEEICLTEKVVTIQANDALRYGYTPGEEYKRHLGQRYLHFAASDWLKHTDIIYTHINLPPANHPLNMRYSRMSFEISSFGHTLAEKFRELQDDILVQNGISVPEYMISGNTFVQALMYEMIKSQE